jgi:hypothetical protein
VDTGAAGVGFTSCDGKQVGNTNGNTFIQIDNSVIAGIRPISLIGAELSYVDFGHPSGSINTVSSAAERDKSIAEESKSIAARPLMRIQCAYRR